MLFINQSGLKTYQNCHRLYGWERLQKLEPPYRRPAPEIGTAVHKGLAAFHAQGGGSIEAAVKAAVAELETNVGPKTRYELQGGTLSEAQEVISRVLPAYLQHWKGQDKLWTPLGQEVQFCIEVQKGWWQKTFGGDKTVTLTPSGLYLVGRSDNLSLLFGGLWIVDYKTAAAMDLRLLAQFEMDMQLSAYIYGLSKKLTEDSEKENGEPVRVQGAVIDLLVKTKVPQFARESYSRTDAEMVEFESEFLEIAREIEQRKIRIAGGEDWKIVLPRSTEQCFRYYNCAFRDLCLKDTSVRRQAFLTRKPDYVDSAEAQALNPAVLPDEPTPQSEK